MHKLELRPRPSRAMADSIQGWQPPRQTVEGTFSLQNRTEANALIDALAAHRDNLWPEAQHNRE